MVHLGTVILLAALVPCTEPEYSEMHPGSNRLTNPKRILSCRKKRFLNFPQVFHLLLFNIPQIFGLIQLYLEPALLARKNP